MLRNNGFSLIEIIIAVAFTAFVTAAAYTNLNQALTTQTRTAENDERLAELQRAMNRIQVDFQQFALRSVRGAFGDPQPAITGEKSADASYVSFTRSGKRNPAKLRRTELERVTYRFEENQLLREQWLVLDLASEEQMVALPILKDVRRFEVEFFQRDDWIESWALDSFDENQRLAVPRAVKVLIELEDFGELQQIFLLPQGTDNQQQSETDRG